MYKNLFFLKAIAMQEKLKPTCAQLEQTLSQRVDDFWHTHLGHHPSKVTCQILGDKIAIVIDNSVTQPEQFLADSGKGNLVERMRFNLDKAIHQQLQNLIEEVVEIPVLDLMLHSSLETSRTSSIVVLAAVPMTRNPSALPQEQQQTDSG